MSNNNSTSDSAERDRWHKWLLERRYGGSEEAREATIKTLTPVAERVIRNASIEEGGVLLDVGTGDGLIAFHAVASLGSSGRIIFSDISGDLLEYCRERVGALALDIPTEFHNVGAEDLHGIPDDSVDAVTTRSVLIYVQDKARAFAEFYRVLKPGGTLSIFEPINRFSYAASGEMSYRGYDFSDKPELATRLLRVLRPESREDVLKNDPMVNFDERDLLLLAEATGFEHVGLSYEAEVTAPIALPQGKKMHVDHFINTAPNPNAITLSEAMARAFTPQETAEFTDYITEKLATGMPSRRSAVVYVTAMKHL
jgi:ubiquinone/menaquinone biosynthesis C-methylase UbiE